MLQPLGSVGQAQEPSNGETKRRLSVIEKVMLAGVLINGVSLAVHLWEMRRREAALQAELARRR